MRQCGICGSTDFEIMYSNIRKEIVSDGFNFKCETRDDINVVKCKNCELLQLDKVISNVDEFYRDSGMLEYRNVSLEMLRKEFLTDHIRQSNNIIPYVKDKKVLDFGCGAGGVLEKIKNVASQICGIELDNSLRDALNHEGIPCYENIEQVGNFDCISMFHVIAHIEKPVDLLKKLCAHLSDNGIIYIETPNANDALLSLYNNKTFSSFTHHKDIIYYFTTKTLKTMCENAGFDAEIKLTQRFPLANHLYWLASNRPGGQNIWKNMVDNQLDEAYSKVLEKNGISDTIIAILKKK